MNARHLRVAAFSVYVVAFVWAAFVFGLPTDRIAVLSWVLGGFVAGAVGRPLWVWRQMVRDFLLFVAMWFAYDYSRGMADQLGFPVNHTLPRDIDRLLFFGTDPNVWMQRHFYEAGSVRWYDVAGALIYFTHFCVPMGIAIALWARNRDRWVQYMRRLATVLFLGVATFVVFPASMTLTLVYFGEHFVFDGILGVAYVLIAFRFWSHYEGSRRAHVQFSSRSAPRFRR